MKKLYFASIILCIFSFCNYACSNDEEKNTTVIMTVASKMGKSETILGNGTVSILWVKYGEYLDWQGLSPNEIKGFNYEEGYEYKIEVKILPIKNPPMDASSIEYYYVKTLSKEKKDSEGLPQ